MAWTVEFHPIFDTEFENFSEEVQDGVFAEIELLERFGPALKRPHADTLNNSKHKNMKELRFKANDGVWRVAYAFDPERKAILLVAGDKSGTSEKRFYKTLIQTADQRFDQHLSGLQESGS